MRDDIHKRVPRPPATQRWVRMAVNDADRTAGRSFEACEGTLRDTCKRKISQDFVRGLQGALNKPAELFEPLANVLTPRDVGGRGGHLEMEALSECRRLLDGGAAPEIAVSESIAAVMKNRSLADIRATQAVLPHRDPKSSVVLDSMKSDVSRINFKTLADSVCSGQLYEPRPRGRRMIDLDGDMCGIGLGGAS